MIWILIATTLPAFLLAAAFNALCYERRRA